MLRAAPIHEKIKNTFANYAKRAFVTRELLFRRDGRQSEDAESGSILYKYREGLRGLGLRTAPPALATHPAFGAVPRHGEYV